MRPTQQDLSADALAFVEWARGQAVPLSIPRSQEDLKDLQFLGAVVGDANVVALGENAHYLHEWNAFRTRLFQYLVEHHGFTTFVLESGLVEGKRIHDYVLGADIEWDSVVAAVTNGWGVWAELQELIRWMRDYNSNTPLERKLHFYGMDGSGNWSHTRHAYAAIHSFLKDVDGDLADEFAGNFEIAAETIQFEIRDAVEDSTWQSLIAESSLLVSRMEQSRVEFAAVASREAYDWALRYIRIFRDQILNMAQTDPDFALGFRAFWNSRDASMADQLVWIIDREGPDARIVVGAHNTHLQQYPVRVQKATSMGSYFSNRIGREKTVFIGAASAYSVKGDAPLPDSSPAAYDEIGPDCFFLDLRTAPALGPVSDWLRAERMDRSNLRYQPVAPGHAWDCLFFHRTVSIAEVALPASLRVNRGTADPRRYDDFVGRYVLLGFLAQPTTLDITRDQDKLYADGRADTSGELFPPLKTPLEASDDGWFLWPNWPAILQFQGDGRTSGITLTMPGMGVYEGARVES